VTVRVPRAPLALAAALVMHAAALFVIEQLPVAKRIPEPVELTFAQAPPPPPPAAASPAPKRPRPARRSAPPPAPSPVVRVLAPTPDEHVELPVVEAAPEPAPAPKPRWQQLLEGSLASSAPVRPRMPSGELAPSIALLERVALADPRLHDEETEQRLMQDHGAFFRRGLEALRGHWHPNEVLNATERDPARKCGHRTRTTFAVAVLDKQGNVVDVDLKNPSGCDELDQEAVAAFKRTAKFPYPPAGIFVTPDGEPMETARYPVRFIVTFDGGLRIDWRG
jgi:TonB family protein